MTTTHTPMKLIAGATRDDGRNLTILRGIPGSGKSTWAKGFIGDRAPSTIRLNRDEFRDMLYGTRSGLDYRQESFITTVEHEAAKRALESGRDVIVDAMNLTAKYFKAWANIGIAAGAAVYVKDFPISVEEAIERDALRIDAGEPGVGEEAIRGIAKRFLRNGSLPDLPRLDQLGATRPEPYVAPVDGLPVVLCDIDGTLALKGERDIYDESRVSEDRVNGAVADLLCALEAAGYYIIFMSGRSENCRADTGAWIGDKARLYWHDLHMRKAGDKRPDTVVKAEIFDREIRDKYDVKLVLDDRPSVIRLWASMGLPVFDVNPTSGEF